MNIDAYLIVYWNLNTYNAAILKIYYSEAMAEKYFNKKYKELVGPHSHLESLYLFKTTIGFIDVFDLVENEVPSWDTANFIMNHLGNIHTIHEYSLD